MTLYEFKGHCILKLLIQDFDIKEIFHGSSITHKMLNDVLVVLFFLFFWTQCFIKDCGR